MFTRDVALAVRRALPGHRISLEYIGGEVVAVSTGAFTIFFGNGNSTWSGDLWFNGEQTAKFFETDVPSSSEDVNEVTDALVAAVKSWAAEDCLMCRLPTWTGLVNGLCATCRKELE